MTTRTVRVLAEEARRLATGPLGGFADLVRQARWRCRLDRPPHPVVFLAERPMHYACFRPVHRLLPRVRVTAMNPDVRGWLGRNGVAHRNFPPNAAGVIASHYQDFSRLGIAGRIPPRVKFIQINHGLGMAKRWFMEAAACHPMDLYLVGNRFARDRLAPLVGGRVVLAGFPKCDRLFDGSLDRGALVRSLGLRADRPTVVYAPSWGPYGSLRAVAPHLRHLAERVNLLVKPHDMILADAERARAEGLLEGAGLVTDPDISPLLFVTDLLVSDVSSVVFEFTPLDRPILLVLPSGGSREDLTMDPAWWEVGRTVSDPADLHAAIDGELRRPDPARSAFRRQLVRDAGIFTDGRSAWRVAEAIRETLAGGAS